MEHVETVLSPETAILLQATGQCKNYQVVEGLCSEGVSTDQDEQILTLPQIWQKNTGQLQINPCLFTMYVMSPVYKWNSKSNLLLKTWSNKILQAPGTPDANKM